MKEKPDVISEADIVIKIWGMAQASIKQRNSPCADNIVRQDTFKWAFAEFSRIRLKDLEQAKAEVARGMIEIAKREVKFSLRRQLLKMPSVYEQRGVSEDLGNRLEQSLKDKWLKKAEK